MSWWASGQDASWWASWRAAADWKASADAYEQASGAECWQASERWAHWSPPPSTLEVARYTTECSGDGWPDEAFAIFQEHGFVLVDGLLDTRQCRAVLDRCEEVAREIVGPEGLGNRGLGRYSFGAASSSGSMLHEPCFVRHLLSDAGGTLRPLLDRIFGRSSGRPQYSVYSGGGDFVLGNVWEFQQLHSDMQVKRALNVKLPPPMVSINFCVQDMTTANGAMRIVPGTQLHPGLRAGQWEPAEWRASRVCPVRAGAAIVRDVRTLHGGTPNYTEITRFLPSIELVSDGLKDTGRKDMFPPIRSLPRQLYDQLGRSVRELCEDIVADPGDPVAVSFLQT
mmetsp:Transcript_127895/g.368409  ORF Transcript_127895/g.368409 Transcript_127895/m.368409 type:complete len:339 (-) Transcript_127895:79-1095(-)